MIRFGALLTAVSAVAVFPQVGNATAQLEFFEKRIRPVLAEHCYACHSTASDRVRGGLRVDTRAELLRGGETGPALVPGSAEDSLLIRAVSYEDPDLQMPPRSRLDAALVADLRQWIEEGAFWPESDAAQATALPGEGFDLKARRLAHWAWQPIRRPEPPPVQDASWPADPIDRFILAGLEAAGLKPAAPADPRVLLRRASFALTGLPPRPGEVERLLLQDSSLALVRAVDAWLASPHFGERWARHWLDKVRYAETLGHEFDYPILGAWRYRDYVVRAFNDDVPYDQFAREQIAGDLMPEPRLNPVDGARESLLATAQFWLGQQVHSPVDVRHHQIEFVDNQIDVLTKSFLGLTVSCARCHDHKFDAISTRDYYAWYGVLASSRYAIRAVDDPAPRRRQAEALAAQRTVLRQTVAAQLLNRAPNGPTTPQVSHYDVALRPEDRLLPLEEWFADGEAFTADPAPGGQPVILGEPDRPALRIVLPGWRHSASLSRRFQGALRSPTFELEQDFLHLQVAGRGARANVVIEGFTLIRAPIYGALRQAIRNEDPHWISLDVSAWRGRRAWIELADWSEDDPASTLGAAGRQPDGWVAVGAVLPSGHRDPPPVSVVHPAVDLASTLRRWAWNPADLSPAEAATLDAVLVQIPPPRLQDTLTEWRRIDAAIEAPILVAAMSDADGWDEPVMVRGNHKTPGENVPRQFLEALRSLVPMDPIGQGSGRRELAEAITHPDNPLFARVMVNWVWAQLFGRGLVASVDNLGALGEKPSHPELLDWLAGEFQRSGGSTKRLIRQILLSHTWQLSSAATDPEAEHLDPDNRLWHRANLRRLEGEALRDAMLAVSGRLDSRVGGPPVPIHLTAFMDGRGRPNQQGPLDGDGRRSLYLEVRRNFLSPFMLAFDAPVPASTLGQRTVSNVPAQALALLNDPFVIGQARHWADRVLREVPTSATQRIERLYEEAFSRLPTDQERARASAFLTAQSAGPTGSEPAAWADLCHVLFNLKEFLYLE
jgi:hypothetical protein